MDDVTGDSRAYVIARRHDSIFFFGLLGGGAARRLNEMAKDQVAQQTTVLSWQNGLPASLPQLVRYWCCFGSHVCHVNGNR